MQTVMLADLSRATSNHFIIAAIATFIAGLLFVAIGYYLGCILFRRWMKAAERIEFDNKKLARKISNLQRKNIDARQSIAGNNQP